MKIAKALEVVRTNMVSGQSSPSSCSPIEEFITWKVAVSRGIDDIGVKVESAWEDDV
jgi:hypothetical protein